MTKQNLINYLNELKGTELTYPFDNITEVFKIGGKMFALIGEMNGYTRINVKGIPEDNYILRSMFDSIIPGYHMNKEHWNTIILDGSIEEDLVKKLIYDSYKIVFNKLPKKTQKIIETQ